MWVDRSTGLMWTKVAYGNDLDWKDAVSYCQNLDGLAGYSGWRLPTLGELKTVYAPSRPSKLKGELDQGSGWAFWSGSTSSGQPWRFCLLDGSQLAGELNNECQSSGAAFCVRSNGK